MRRGQATISPLDAEIGNERLGIASPVRAIREKFDTNPRNKPVNAILGHHRKAVVLPLDIALLKLTGPVNLIECGHREDRMRKLLTTPKRTGPSSRTRKIKTIDGWFS